VIPANLIERLTDSFARWDAVGRPTPDEEFQVRKAMASAIMSVPVWNSNNS
jgi:hypothetical protein